MKKLLLLLTLGVFFLLQSCTKDHPMDKCLKPPQVSGLSITADGVDEIDELNDWLIVPTYSDSDYVQGSYIYYRVYPATAGGFKEITISVPTDGNHSFPDNPGTIVQGFGIPYTYTGNVIVEVTGYLPANAPRPCSPITVSATFSNSR